MGFLPDFTLSSNPEITVRLREATVEDAIDFSELDPAFEEEATTVFLDRMQAPEKYTDPRCWTGSPPCPLHVQVAHGRIRLDANGLLLHGMSERTCCFREIC